MDTSFFQGKKVFVTGHTGFKGTWLCQILQMWGAEVTGYSLAPKQKGSFFEQSGLEQRMCSVIGDVRDFHHLWETFEAAKPEIVFHLAAQPLVIDSYENPVYTYETNVMGTVHILECIRKSDSVKSFINVTTDKVYKNKEWEWGYRENEELNGFDPYSNSKSCSELVTSSYLNSFLLKQGVAVSTMRAGNVIGGGDDAANRIIPDCIRAARKGETIPVRNPFSIRPYQHVLEALKAYLLVAEKQYLNTEVAGSYNVGPAEEDCLKTGDIVTLFCREWNQCFQGNLSWNTNQKKSVHEATFLKLDCSKMKRVFSWKPVWPIEKAIQKIVEWENAVSSGEETAQIMKKQIGDFFECE